MTEDGAEEATEDEEAVESTDDTNQVRVSRKSPMELLVMCSPVMHATCLVYPGLYFLSLDMPGLLISVVPDESRNFVIISLCLAWDSFFLSVGVAWSTYTIFVVMSFVLTLKDTVDLVMKRISIR